MQQGAFGAVFGDPFLRGEVLRPSVDFGTRDLCTLRAVSVAFRGDTLLVSRFTVRGHLSKNSGFGDARERP